MNKESGKLADIPCYDPQSKKLNHKLCIKITSHFINIKNIKLGEHPEVDPYMEGIRSCSPAS